MDAGDEKQTTAVSGFFSPTTHSSFLKRISLSIASNTALRSNIKIADDPESTVYWVQCKALKPVWFLEI